MKTSRLFIPLLVWLFAMPAVGQTVSYFNQGFLRQPSAQADRDYLGISSAGSGSVTNFAIGNLSPLFTAGVANPTTFPTVTFTPVGQAANLVFASPSGGIGFPSFRSLTTSDLPSITAIVRGDVSATAPVLYDNTTGVFSMHVADATHDGYLSMGDWTIFNNKGNGTVTSITNASQPLVGNSMIGTFVGPVPTIKSVAAGANMAISDNGSTLTFSASGIAGGSGATDFMQYQTNYSVTYRTIAPDATQFGTATFVGFGDAMGISSPATGSGLLVWNFGSPALGPWVQMVTGATSGNTAFIATTTDNAVAAYTNGGFYFQTYVLVRNTNTVRIAAGFTSSSFAAFLANDTTITNYAYFRYSTLSNDSTWHGVVCDATNRFFVDTGAPLVPDTSYLLQMWKTNGTTNVVFAVNRTNIATATAFVPNRTAQLSDLMGVFAGEATLANAVKTNWFRYIGYTVDWQTK